MALDLYLPNAMVLMIACELTLKSDRMMKRIIAIMNDTIAHMRYAYGRLYTMASGRNPSFEYDFSWRY